MNNRSAPFRFDGRIPRLMASQSVWSRWALPALAMLALSLGGGGCGRNDTTRVLLQSRQTADSDIARLDVLAQVSGPQLAGLRYRWYAITGHCTPQESDWPATVFRFAAGSIRDRVTVEVVRDGEVIAENNLDVALDDERAQAQREHVPEVQINITKVPPYDPYGGPDTRADIAGTISGQLEPGCKVVIYARADAWYIQPVSGAQLSIRPDNTWATWTHTGSSYAVLVVRRGYDPFARLDVLPQLGGYVIGRTTIDGKLH